jgi:hypothetical protein
MSTNCKSRWTQLVVASAIVGGILLNASAAMASYMATVLADSPTAYYRLGESSGTTMTDASGNSNNGTYSGSPTLGTTGAVAGDTAVSFNGSQRGITPFLFNPSATSWSLEFWANPTVDGRSSQRALVSQQDGTGTGRDWIFETTSGGLSTFFNATQQDWTGGALPLNTYTFISLTCDVSTGTLRWYKNGTFDTSYAVTIESATGAVIVGNEKFPTSSNGFIGAMDEAALFTTRLSDAQIQSHFAAAPEPTAAAILIVAAPFLARRNWW